MSLPVLVLIHAPWETPALVDVALGDIPVERRCVVDEREPALPRASALGGLVVMGGPQDADDDARHPGLAAERRLLAEATDAGVPTLGVCLGMQLLGLALGARLHLRHGVEIGFASVDGAPGVASDPVLGPMFARPEATFLHWHSDAVELPAGAELLASTAATPVQAFRAGSALGVQFHPEADSALLGAWLATPEMTRGLGEGAVRRAREDGARFLPELRGPALAGLEAFASAIRARRER